MSAWCLTCITPSSCTRTPRRCAAPLLYVREVHIAQFVDGEKHYLRADHAADCAAYFRQLREARYSGEIAVEATYDDLSEALPRSNALLRQWAADGAKRSLTAPRPGWYSNISNVSRRSVPTCVIFNFYRSRPINTCAAKF